MDTSNYLTHFTITITAVFSETSWNRNIIDNSGDFLSNKSFDINF